MRQLARNTVPTLRFLTPGVVTSSADTTYGLYTSLTRTGSTNGVINSYGNYVTATGDNGGSGSTTLYGSYCYCDWCRHELRSLSTVTAVSGSTNYGLRGAVVDATTAASANYGGYVSFADSGVVTSGTDSTTGLFINGSRTGATGGTIDTIGLNVIISADNAGSGTSTATAIRAEVFFDGPAPDTGYGVYIANTAGTTDYGLYQASSDDDNYFAGNVGIGDTTPNALFTVGNTSQFQVNSSGAIAAATGITSSGTITFSAFTTNGGLLYTNGSGTLAQTAAGTSGQALVSGGAGAPTYYAPTAGSVLFAGTSGILEQDNANFFYDDTLNRLGLGDITPDAPLDIEFSSTSSTAGG
jgi:hypothetical protein